MFFRAFIGMVLLGGVACFPSRHSLEGRACDSMAECRDSGVCLFGQCQTLSRDAALPDRPVQEWSAAASLHFPRRDHQALEVGPGLLLIIGGRDASGPIASIELYDLLKDETRLVASLQQARAIFSATRLLNDHVIILGGLSSDSPSLSSCELLNLTNGIVTGCPAMAQARVDFFSFLLPDGRVWVVGSGDGRASELYDPSTQLWSAGPQSQGFRVSGDALALDQGKVLLTGSGVCEIYTPASGAGTLNRLADCPPVSYNQATARLGTSQVVLAGGTNQNTSGSLSRVDILELSSLTWSSGPALPEGREDHELVTLPDGRALVVGGFESSASGLKALTSALTLSSNAAQWTQVDAPATALEGHTLTVMRSGHVIRVGGASSAGPQATLEVFNP